MALFSRARVCPAYSSLLERGFHATSSAASHIGSAPIPVPPSVSLELPTSSISPDLTLATPSARRVVTVSGPLGSHSIVLLPPVILHPPTTESAFLNITIHDPLAKRQRSAWGLTRSLINNAIIGVSEGYNVELRLVGVGYRAAVEPIPEVFRELQKQIPRKPRARKPGSPPPVGLPDPVDRLNIKLGYSHPVLIDIPADIKVAIPAPTRIVISGIDKQRLGVFAARIRNWRKPEPYRGKGIFIGDETIKLKEVKKK